MEPVNPWVSIWSKPKATILQVIGEDPKRGLWMLATIYGILSLFNCFQTFALGYAMTLLPIVLLALVFAPLWGMLFFSLWSCVILWIGKLLGGKGSFSLIRASYAWSCAPLVFNLLLWAMLLTIFGVSLFQNFPENYPIQTSQVIILFCGLICKVIISIWSFVIFINTLAEVQQFSVGRSILNIILAWVAVALVAGLIWWVIISH